MAGRNPKQQEQAKHGEHRQHSQKQGLARTACDQAKYHRAGGGDDKNCGKEAPKPVRYGQRIERSRLDLQRLAICHNWRSYLILNGNCV